MLGEAYIDRLDRGSQRFHNGEDQGIAKDKGQEHVKYNRGITHVWCISISLMHQNGPRENDNHPRNSSTHTRTHVCGNVIVYDGLDAYRQNRNYGCQLVAKLVALDRKQIHQTINLNWLG
jgi:hypothetical protein